MFGRISMFRHVSGGLAATLLLFLAVTSASARELNNTVEGADVSAIIPGITLELAPTTKQAQLVDLPNLEGENLSSATPSVITQVGAGGIIEANVRISPHKNLLWYSNDMHLGRASADLYGKLLARSNITVELVAAGRQSG